MKTSILNAFLNEQIIARLRLIEQAAVSSYSDEITFELYRDNPESEDWYVFAESPSAFYLKDNSPSLVSR